MDKLRNEPSPERRRVRKIAVIGAGIVGVPMAALLAQARIRLGTERPARVVLIQRKSPTSGWKVEAINAGRSPIGGIEPQLGEIVAETVAAGLLKAGHDYALVRDADAILICVQTDKSGSGPDYGPLFEAVRGLAQELQSRPPGRVPLVIFESTLAPSSMTTLIRREFAGLGLEEGRDILLGNSPNRVMPGHLVERIRSSDKIIGGLSPVTTELIRSLYSKIVTEGRLHLTNSLTAEVVKTLENAYRDVRIAFSTEIARYCDDHGTDFYEVREAVNKRLSWSDSATLEPEAVPTGGLMIPTIGVGGHCLPKDGILLLWRKVEAGGDVSASLILEARRINDESPAAIARRVEQKFGSLRGRGVALLGAAYRADSEDTRNSPALTLAGLLLDRGCRLSLHDPFVKPGDQNLAGKGLQNIFTNEIDLAVAAAEVIIFGAAHQVYRRDIDEILGAAPELVGVYDGCNLTTEFRLKNRGIEYGGIGKGAGSPASEFLDSVERSFRAVETGLANELKAFIDFANERYADSSSDRLDFQEVQGLAATCVTGCRIADPGSVKTIHRHGRFLPRLVRCAMAGSP
jgi:UDP-N-acetyl-D-mannosaminuronic acid dehydrogenase